MRTVLSSPPETICAPSGLKPTDLNAPGMAVELGHLLATGHIPDAHRAVTTARDDLRPIRAEPHRLNLPGMAVELRHLLATGHIPDAHRAVITARDDLRPIRAEPDRI